MKADIERGGARNYILFNLQILFFLLFKPMQVIHCHDLWPLPAASVAALWKHCALVYDAHEYYAGLHIFSSRPFRKSVWMVAEWLAMPIVDYLITVSEPLADFFRKRYPNLRRISVIRNVPSGISGKAATKPVIERRKEEKLIIFQGHFKPDRGLVQLIEAVGKLENVALLLVGGGELEDQLIKLVEEKSLSHCVRFLKYFPTEVLPAVSAQADIGAVLFEGNSLNYRYALPNKFFEYLMAGIPVLTSSIPTLEEYVNRYDVGITVNPQDSNEIADAIDAAFSDTQRFSRWKANAKKASGELNWENEQHLLKQIYDTFR